MSSKQEVLRYLRESAGDMAISFDTTLRDVTAALDMDLEHLVDELEVEFGVELPDEVLPDVDTVADLAQTVVEAQRAAGDDDDEA
jgi:acyl carrier protein